MKSWFAFRGLTNNKEIARQFPELGGSPNIGNHFLSENANTSTLHKFAEAAGFHWEIVFWPKGEVKPIEPKELTDAEIEAQFDEIVGRKEATE